MTLSEKIFRAEHQQEIRRGIRTGKGFTLIELLVVAAILAVLSFVVIVNLEKAKASSRDSKRIGDLAIVKSSITMYRAAKGTFPTNPVNNVVCGFPGNSPAVVTYMGGVYDCLTELTQQGYIDRLPEDPQPDQRMYGWYNYQNYGYYVLFARTEIPKNNPDVRASLICKDGTNCFADGGSASGSAVSLCRPPADGDAENTPYEYCLSDPSS